MNCGRGRVRDFNWTPRELQGGGEEVLGRKDGQGETQMVRKDGRSVLVEYSAKANYLPGRHFIVLRDISPRKQAETARRESDERFQQMAFHILEVFDADAQTKSVIYVNQASKLSCGRSPDTLRANPTSYQELFHPEDRIRVLTRLEEAVRYWLVWLKTLNRVARPAIRWVSARGFLQDSPAPDSSLAEPRRISPLENRLRTNGLWTRVLRIRPSRG